MGEIKGGITVSISKSNVRRDVWDKSNGRCWYCGVQTNPWKDFCIDHHHPSAKGGSDEIDNLVPCCRTCNSRKSARDIEYLRQRLGRISSLTFTVEQIEFLKSQGVDVDLPTADGYVFYFEKERLI